LKRRRATTRVTGAGANLAAALGQRMPRRRAVQVRSYDARGHAHLLDPAGDPGKRLVEAAEAMLKVAGEAPPESRS
jgi:hypothetical protein